MDENPHYLSRHLVVLPSKTLWDNGSTIIISRCKTQAYFVKDLHERDHFELGENGLTELKKDLHDGGYECVHIHKDKNYFNSQEKIIVLNKHSSLESNNSNDLLETVETVTGSILKNCDVTLNTAFKEGCTKRGTVCVNYGFTMNKCTELQPINALWDYNIPIHYSSVPSMKENRFILQCINNLVLHFERHTKSGNHSFGVIEGGWFKDNNVGCGRAALADQFVSDLGMEGTVSDWRVFGATLIVRSDGVKMHKDTRNSIHDNFSMVLSFNHVMQSDVIPLHIRKKIFCDATVPEYFNVNLVVYGRQCVDSLVEKFEKRKTTMNNYPILNSIITALTESDSYSYDDWLSTHAEAELINKIPVMSSQQMKDKIMSYNASASEFYNIQHNQNDLFNSTFYAKPSVMNKALYWSSMVTAYYNMMFRFQLSCWECWELIMFLATELNGTYIVGKMFFWYLLQMTPDEYKKKVNKFPSHYIFLCHILKTSVNWYVFWCILITVYWCIEC